jgi:pimeloyl-ACP methyl ester carboxylesterase
MMNTIDTSALRVVFRIVAVAALATSACGSDDSAEGSALSTASATTAPYTEREVEFDQTVDGHILAGTLSLPLGDGPHSGVVLITGSGSQDRNETIGSIKPFAALADRLARAGIAVLRFDDRGVGGSGGKRVEVSGATTRDLAEDARAAVEFLATQPEIDPSRVGVIGHSEGGLIAPIAANESDAVRFAVLLAGSAVPGAQVLERQTGDITAAEGASPEIVEWSVGWTRELIAISASDASPAEAEAEMREVASRAIAGAPPGAVDDNPDAAVDQTIAAFLDPWMRFFLAYDPAPALAQLEVPVLAVFGGLDLQVSAEDNAPAAETALAGNADATVVVIDEVNHLFQVAVTGAVSEYDTLDEPFEPGTTDQIVDWIETHI